MRESRLSGSVRGVLSNGHPYRDPAPEAASPRGWKLVRRQVVTPKIVTKRYQVKK